MKDISNLLSFYKNKKVFITGHTGFKGSWLCQILNNVGADITGYSIDKSKLFMLNNIEKDIKSIIGDIRNKELLINEFKKAQPEIVIHLAAQPIVQEGYINPSYTYEVNVMGTLNILECIRINDCVKSFINVTTDKVYHNIESNYKYIETDTLDGYDPYSNSKSCSELITNGYRRSFFNNKNIAISTARSGNVIGGGDFASNRIIPDCFRAIEKGEDILVRNPKSIRPYQHVLEALYAYLLIVKNQYNDNAFAGSYNIGPDESDCVKTEELVKILCEKWGNRIVWKNVSVEGPHEANLLMLDNSKIKQVLNWKPNWCISQAVEKTVEWFKEYLSNGDTTKVMHNQIDEFLQGK